MASSNSMDSDRKVSKALFAMADSTHEINEVSPPTQPSPSAGGSVNTVGNDRDNSSEDEVGGPDNSSSQVTSLHKKIQNDLANFNSTLGLWHQRARELGMIVSGMTRENQHSTRSLKDKLRAVKLEISRLKLSLPALPNSSKAKSSTPGLSKIVIDTRSSAMLAKLPAEFASPIIQGLLQPYYSLDDKTKNCLLSLTAFPENAIIRKRILINWWVGEEFLVVPDRSVSMAIEKAAECIFKELGNRGLIMLVHKKQKKRSPIPDSCQLHPLVRRILITIAEKANFLDFDSEGNVTTRSSECPRVCLQSSSSSLVSREGKLWTLFNMNDQFLDLKLDSFKECKVLQLGRWAVSADHIIDVVDASSLLRGIGTMKSLRYLSLQGVVTVGELPASICKLSNLTILDLRGCQSLETLPSEIGSLLKLTYLDFSECYFISHMPKSLVKLRKLRVLKGFVLYGNDSADHEEACTLSDLAAMPKLWKLSFKVDNAAELGDEHMHDLYLLPELRSLTITWIHAPKQPDFSDRRADSNSKRVKKYFKKAKEPKDSLRESRVPFPCKLTKLDLRCYPGLSMPEWLTPWKAKNLEKLYIRGGNLANLNVDFYSSYQWQVKILRLKFLANFEIEWSDLQDHFPSLVYLEKFWCPKLEFSPCDSYGVWMKTHAKEEE